MHIEIKIYSYNILMLENLKLFIQLTRLNKPIGIYLLLWPVLTALYASFEGYPPFKILIIFILGSVLTRSLGCIINDLWDKNFDGRVLRTQNRPLTSNNKHREKNIKKALVFAACLSGVALYLLSLLPLINSFVALYCAVLIVIYPVMKRFISLPQVFLGAAFSGGTLMAFAANNDLFNLSSFIFYLAIVIWALIYDTFYALVDMKDDLELGIKSTATLFKNKILIFLSINQILMLILLVFFAYLKGLSWIFYLGLLVITLLFCYQNYLIFDKKHPQHTKRCFLAFLNNNIVGIIMLASILANYLLIL